MKNKKINDKKVLILGASSDIGIEISKIYLEKGYKVIGHFSRENQKFTELLKKYKNFFKIKFNFITTYENIEKFLKNKLLLSSDIVINALGFVEQINFKKLKIRDIDKSLKVNFYPGIFITSKIGHKLVKKKWGRIVHLGSIGVKFGGGMSNLPYSLSKFNLEFFPNYTKQWIKDNVLINTIRVGTCNTKLHKNLPSKNLKKRVELIPAKRMANVGEIARFVYFIGSEENTYISHQVLPISGGE
jgi:3-oxoacyl-[acyl-carrier protein] reductase